MFPSSPSKYNAFAHMPISNISRIQEWTDPYSGISTLFVYEPEKPIIDTFTPLDVIRIKLSLILYHFLNQFDGTILNILPCPRETTYR
jgi:hypothetical protein